MTINVLGNFGDLETMEIFWETMVSGGNVWLYDQSGYQPINPLFLPNWEGLSHDPYRSLAHWAQHAGAYAKTVCKPALISWYILYIVIFNPFCQYFQAVSYADFMWANLFREYIHLGPSLGDQGPTHWRFCEVAPYNSLCWPTPQANVSIHAAVPSALKIALSSVAAGLPGYGKGVVSQTHCSW